MTPTQEFNQFISLPGDQHGEIIYSITTGDVMTITLLLVLLVLFILVFVFELRRQ